MRVNKLILPPFTQTFQLILKLLEQAADSSLEEQKALFRDFYQEYGTHYIYEAKFGSSMTVESRHGTDTTN